MKMKIKKWTRGQMKMERPPIKKKFKIEYGKLHVGFSPFKSCCVYVCAS
jgi:hypothetical protein